MTAGRSGDEARVERVAKAIYEAEGSDRAYWDQYHDHYVKMAKAALREVEGNESFTEKGRARGVPEGPPPAQVNPVAGEPGSRPARDDVTMMAQALQAANQSYRGHEHNLEAFWRHLASAAWTVQGRILPTRAEIFRAVSGVLERLKAQRAGAGPDDNLLHHELTAAVFDAVQRHAIREAAERRPEGGVGAAGPSHWEQDARYYEKLVDQRNQEIEALKAKVDHLNQLRLDENHAMSQIVAGLDAELDRLKAGPLPTRDILSRAMWFVWGHAHWQGTPDEELDLTWERNRDQPFKPFSEIRAYADEVLALLHPPGGAGDAPIGEDAGEAKDTRGA